jgi:hypothetical protein
MKFCQYILISKKAKWDIKPHLSKETLKKFFYLKKKPHLLLEGEKLRIYANFLAKFKLYINLI